MLFEVFRRNQRKMLAVLAVFAMVAFTLDFSLFRGGDPSGMGPDPVVMTIDGEAVRRSEINRLKFERSRANRFMALLGAPTEFFFGPLEDDEMRDALVLEREADRLGIPRSIDLAKRWLNEATQGELTPALFDRIYRDNFANDRYPITDVQLLADIAGQVRLLTLMTLPGAPNASLRSPDLSALTPLDVYQAFRDRRERVSAQVVAIDAEEFLDKVPDPSDAEVRSYYDKYKDEPTDPARETPGFRSPRRVRVEYLIADQAGLVEQIEAELTDEDLRKRYQEDPADFPDPGRELPRNLFAGDKENELTPTVDDPFLRVRPRVRDALALERAREQSDRLFDRARQEVFEPFISRYAEAEDANDLAAEAGKPAKPLPEPRDEAGKTLLLAFADREGIESERRGATPAITREEAEDYLPISRAQIGSTWPSGGAGFAEYIFDRRPVAYEPFELADPQGRRYIAWKIEDSPPATPPLNEIRDQVVRAWKLEKARELARSAAEELAAKARETEGGLRAVAAERTVETTAEVSKLSEVPDPTMPFGPGLTRPTDIPQIKLPGDELREALFNLKPGEVAVAANSPKSVYYVLAGQARSDADLNELFGPLGFRSRIEFQVAFEKARERDQRWMETLRKQSKVEVVEDPDRRRGDELDSAAR